MCPCLDDEAGSLLLQGLVNLVELRFHKRTVDKLKVLDNVDNVELSALAKLVFHDFIEIDFESVGKLALISAALSLGGVLPLVSLRFDWFFRS